MDMKMRIKKKRTPTAGVRAARHFTALLLAAFLAALLPACGRQTGQMVGNTGINTGTNAEAEARAFGIDFMQELMLQDPAQVVCGRTCAWAVTIRKDEPIYQFDYEAGSASGLQEIEWRQQEGETLLNVAEQGYSLYAAVQVPGDDSIEIRRHSYGQWDTVMSINGDGAEWEWYIVGGGLFVDSSENAYLSGQDAVTCFGAGGQQACRYQLDGNACLFRESGEGDVECLAAGAEGVTLYVLGESRAEEKWSLGLPAMPAGQVHGIQGSDGGTLCLAAGEELLFIDGETGSLLAGADLSTAGAPPVMAGTYDAGAETLRLYGVDGASAGNLSCSLLSARDPSAEQRTEIVYGVMGKWEGGTTNNIKEAVSRFNRENEDYYVTIRNYYGDWDRQRLHADMAGGNAPDIIELEDTDYYWHYVENGYLEELSHYLEQSEYGDDILWNVLDTYRADGGLYLLTPQFQVEGILLHPEYAEYVEEWDMDTFLGLLERDRWDKKPFWDYYDRPENLLYELLSGRQEEFIDREGKKASFEGTEFTELLALCREYGEQDWSSTDGWSWEEEQWNTLCNTFLLSLGPASNYLGLDKTDIYGREYPIYGYPTSSGQAYKLRTCPDCCAIYAGSEHKDGAWEFMESLLGESYQNWHRSWSNSGLPIRCSLLEKLMEEEKDKSIGSSGNTKTLTDGELAIMENVIYNGEFVSERLDTDIWNVVQEESAYYFAGDKSAEEVAHIIQNRVQLILSE